MGTGGRISISTEGVEVDLGLKVFEEKSTGRVSKKVVAAVAEYSSTSAAQGFAAWLGERSMPVCPMLAQLTGLPAQNSSSCPKEADRAMMKKRSVKVALILRFTYPPVPRV